jgi:hypothetical protein
MDIKIDDNIVEVLNNGEPYFFDIGFGLQSFLEVEVSVYRDFYNWVKENNKVNFSSSNLDENNFLTKTCKKDGKIICMMKTNVKDERIDSRGYLIDVYELRDYLFEGRMS